MLRGELFNQRIELNTNVSGVFIKNNNEDEEMFELKAFSRINQIHLIDKFIGELILFLNH